MRKTRFFICLYFGTIFHLSGQTNLQKINPPKNLLDSLAGITTMDTTLNEVVVSARRKRIQLTDAGFIYKLQEDPSVASENLLFALRRVPMVNVDGEGQIQVRGSGDYTIYLNGKPYTLANSNPKEVLQSIPASSIEKVEVITNLDARYDASSGGAILNIITAKKKLDGYQVILNASGATYPSANAGATLLLAQNRWSLSSGYSYNEQRILDVPGESYREMYREEAMVDLNTAQSTGNSTFRTHTARALFEYNIDTLNTLYTDANWMFQDKDTRMQYENSYVPAESESSYTQTFNQVVLRDGAGEFNLSYRNLYPQTKQERLMLAYRYAYNPDNRGSNVLERRFEPAQTGTESPHNTEYQHRSSSSGGLNEHTLQLDYTLPVGKRHHLSMGAKDIYRNGNSQSYYEIWNPQAIAWESGSFYPHDPATDRFRQRQNIISGYLTYKYNVGNFSMNVGVRGEFTNSRIYFQKAPDRGYTSRNVDFIPRLQFSYHLTRHSQLAISYIPRIRRPSIWQMNPYREQLDEFQAEYGNPHLKSEKKNQVSLSYNYFTEKVSLSTWIDYMNSNRIIIKYPHTVAEDKKVLEYTYGNLGKYRKILGGFYLGYSPVPALNFTVNGTLANIYMESGELDLAQDAISYSLSVACDWSPGKNWYLGANWAVFQQEPEMQISYTHFHKYAFYLRKGFLDNRLGIGLNVASPFQKYFQSIKTAEHPNFLNKNTYHIVSRNLTLNLSYTFGSQNTAVKRKVRIQNDDLIK